MSAIFLAWPPTFPEWLRGQAGSGPPGRLAGLQHAPGTPTGAPCPGGSDFPALLFSESAQTAGLCQKKSPGQAMQGGVLCPERDTCSGFCQGLVKTQPLAESQADTRESKH